MEYEAQKEEFNSYEDFLISNKLFQFNLLTQLLKLYNLPFDWFHIILDLAWKSCDLVKPDIKHDNDQMDIRSYLKIKKLPGELFFPLLSQQHIVSDQNCMRLNRGLFLNI